jgi:NADPH2:quinone reductase
VEIGKAMGATVIATASSPLKLELARHHGADHVIDYTREDLRKRVLSLTDGLGADVIYDPVGGDVFDISMRCVASEGRIVVIGFASGRVPQVPANILLVKNVDVIGFYWGYYRMNRPEWVHQTFKTLFDWFELGKIKPHVSKVFNLSEARDAIELLSRRKSTGKVVLVTGRV